MTDKTEQPPRVDPQFLVVALELAEGVGKSKKHVIDVLGSQSTFDRSKKGLTPLAAKRLRDALKDWGADVSRLPALALDDAPVGEPLSDWDAEWLRLGRALRASVTDAWWDERVEPILVVARAHATVLGGHRNIHSPIVSDKRKR